MTMVRNESVTRIIMLLCFGTAILSLFVHWRMRTAETSSFGDSGVSLGASVPISPNQTPQTKSGTVDKNVVRGAYLPRKQKLVVQGQRQNSTGLAQQKALNSSVSANTEVVVDLSDRRVYVYRGDTVMASYPTGIGKKGWETPTGAFEIAHMQYHPVWRHPITGKVFEAGPDSPLGDRWIGFWSDGRNKIGFHGTPDDDLVGKAISHGCLRMRNPDVRMLYKQVGLGTTVVVRH
jgi:lipoprotein-anchoring transpeptidase ErfK/SrfK